MACGHLGKIIGDLLAYCSASDVRLLTGWTTSDIDDSTLTSIITYVTSLINHEINSKIIEEQVTEIDSTRQNKIDGLNTTYYVQKSFEWFVGDMNDDGSVTTSDIAVYNYDSDAVKTQLTVSSVTPNDGKFVLSSAPSSSNTLTVTYVYSPVSESDPHPLLRYGAANLAAAIASLRLYSVGDFNKLVLGKLRLETGKADSTAFAKYYSVYNRILDMLKSRSMRRVSDDLIAWFKGDSALRRILG